MKKSLILVCLLCMAGCVSKPVIMQVLPEDYKGLIDEDLAAQKKGVLINHSEQLTLKSLIPFIASDMLVTIMSINDKPPEYDKGKIYLSSGVNIIKATCQGQRTGLGGWAVLGSAMIELHVKAGGTYHIYSDASSFSACSIAITSKQNT